MTLNLILKGNLCKIHPVNFKTRPKKVVLFPKIGRVKIFLSPNRPHKFPLENLFVRIYVFSLQTIKDRALIFFKKEKYC